MRIELEDAVHAACCDLRFAEGLRRRSAQARAETSVQEAYSLASANGIRIELSAFRKAVAGGAPEADFSADSGLDYAAGLWRATWRVMSALPDLNVRNGGRVEKIAPAQMLAVLHRDVTAALVRAGQVDLERVAMPALPGGAAAFLGLLTSLEADRRSGQITGLDVVARTWAQLASGSLFELGADAVAANYAKWQLAGLGIEPTAVSVLSRFREDSPTEYGQALAAWRGGETAQWDEYVAHSIIRGCQAGQVIAKQILAGESEKFSTEKIS